MESSSAAEVRAASICTGPIQKLQRGAIISGDNGQVTAYALGNLDSRGSFFVEPGTGIASSQQASPPMPLTMDTQHSTVLYRTARVLPAALTPTLHFLLL